MIDKKVNAEHEINKKARRAIKEELMFKINKNELESGQRDVQVAKKVNIEVMKVMEKVKENSSRIQENANGIMTNASKVATNSATMISIIGQLKM